MPDDLLERLGNYFVHMDIANRYGIPFSRFLEMWDRDTWKEAVAV